MIPFVAGGGLLIALGFLLGGYTGRRRRRARSSSTTRCGICPPAASGQYLGSVAFMIGVTSMNFLVPPRRLHRVRDRRPAGHRAGFVAGAVAVLMSSGFIGGIAGGLLAGFVALWFARLDVPRWLRGSCPS